MDALISLLMNHGPELAAMLLLYILLTREIGKAVKPLSDKQSDLELKVKGLTTQFQDFLYGKKP